ncbi:MAG: hypothetical protein CMC80_00030 [Flavobacteriaceae bacterium]|nr:hypothetical protein [Flavobacteriaceae bacterium]|tara:strand:- start:9604 stop:10575 length:972 start_codon:yes stop_codon:yes gene_type:complete
MNRIFTFFMLIVFTFSLSAQTITTADTSFFDDGPNATWTSVYVAATSNDGNTGEAQNMVFYVTELPEGGANYRIAKSTQNGQNFFGNVTALTLGKNTINVGAVTFSRYVKVQFSSDAIKLSAIIRNNQAVFNDMIYNSNLFDDIQNNANWAYVYTCTTANGDGAASQAQQVLKVTVASMPDEGANYRVYKTTANGGDFFSGASALSLGENTITVAAVTFNRTVKVQFSSGDIAVSKIVLNGTTTLNIDEINSGSFTIYPNPVYDKLSVNGIENINSVKIFNSLGALVKHSNSANDIDVSDLSKGIHFIQVDNGNIITKKFLKK